VPSRLELKVPPLLVVLILGVAMLGAARAAPMLSFRLPGHVVVALALLGAGVALALAGVLAFRRQGTTVNPLTPSATSSFVSGGVYRVSRNPMYLGFLLLLAGWAAYLANAGAALLLPGFVFYMTRYQIKPEERALLEKFGGDYGQYASRVRRWL
jgi:protein-S-isoprenylcysteine O-methyltransferase Ste14